MGDFMKVAILGTGAYGIALATMFYENKCNISMWSKFEEEVKFLTNKRKSKLLDVKIPKEIDFTKHR